MNSNPKNNGCDEIPPTKKDHHLRLVDAINEISELRGRLYLLMCDIKGPVPDNKESNAPEVEDVASLRDVLVYGPDNISNGIKGCHDIIDDIKECLFG